VRYSEFRPREVLCGVAVCTWERVVSPAGAPPSSRVLPDGCVDLVWRAPDLVVAGPDSGPVLSPLQPGETIVGLRLRPGAAGPVLGLPASEVLDARVSLADLWGRAGAQLTERLGQAHSPQGRRCLLEEIMLARMQRMESPDELVLAATRQLGLPGARVASLSEQLGTSERQLLRRFDAAVGYGPKVLDRVLRFRRFVAAVSGDEDLARLAAELGYADQAHLTRECVRLSGLTPRRLASGSP
jgi:AraC-like DNA-binding protein